VVSSASMKKATATSQGNSRLLATEGECGAALMGGVAGLLGWIPLPVIDT